MSNRAMAINWDILKAQYLQGSPTAQLGSLALNITHIHLLAQGDSYEPVAKHLIRESQFFIEWIVPDLDMETDMACATDLVDLQRLLSRWKLSGSDIWIQ